MLSKKRYFILSVLPPLIFGLTQITPIRDLSLNLFLMSIPVGASFWMGVYGFFLAFKTLQTERPVRELNLVGLFLATMLSGSLAIIILLSFGFEISRQLF
jgi:hypothetical protein